MLSSILSKAETKQVLTFAGGTYHPERIEAVLRKMHPHIGDTDRRQGRGPSHSPKLCELKKQLEQCSEQADWQHQE